MTAEDPISRLDLERYVLDRLDSADREALDARIAADPAVRQRVETLRSAIAEAAVDLPAFVVPTDELQSPGAPPVLKVVSSQGVERPQPQPRRFRWAVASGVFLAAAGVALVVIPGGGPGDELFRGSFDLQVQHVRAGVSAPVDLLVEARTGDKLQYTVTPARSGWWMVADIQDDGKVSMWTAPRRVEAGVSSTAAVQLDGYQGSERAFFIVSEDPMELERVREAYANAWRTPLAELDTLPGLPAEQRSIFIVRKNDRP